MNFAAPQKQRIESIICREGFDEGEGRGVHKAHHVAIDIALTAGDGECGIVYANTIGGIVATEHHLIARRGK